MATKSGQKGRYITKVGHFDIYAKDTHKPNKVSKFNFTKSDVASTEYVIYHAKKIIQRGFNSKNNAVEKAISLLGNKVVNYGLG